MKHYFLFLGMLCLMAFPACNKTSLETIDDLETPEYAEEAAKYTITDEDSIYESVELTESGDYIIIKRTDDDDYYDYENASLNTTTVTTLSKVTALSNKSLFKNRNMPLTRGSYSGILYGTYTKTGTNEYYLNDIGTLKITSAESSLYQLVITYTDGSTETIPGKMESKIDNSTLVNKLCRTWGVSKYEFYVIFNSKDYYIKSGDTFNDLIFNMIEDPCILFVGDDTDWVDETYLTEDYETILNMTFTRSRTMIGYYQDDSYDVLKWKLLSQSDSIGKIQLLLDVDEDYYDEADVYYFYFSSGYLILEQRITDDENDGNYYGFRIYLRIK